MNYVTKTLRMREDIYDALVQAGNRAKKPACRELTRLIAPLLGLPPDYAPHELVEIRFQLTHKQYFHLRSVLLEHPEWSVAYVVEYSIRKSRGLPEAEPRCTRRRRNDRDPNMRPQKGVFTSEFVELVGAFCEKHGHHRGMHNWAIQHLIQEYYDIVSSL